MILTESIYLGSKYILNSFKDSFLVLTNSLYWYSFNFSSSFKMWTFLNAKSKEFNFLHLLILSRNLSTDETSLSLPPQNSNYKLFIFGKLAKHSEKYSSSFSSNLVLDK